MPREHHETLADLPDELVGPLFANARLLSEAVPRAMKKPGSFVALNNVVSQSVPHLHVHVVPRKPKDGLRGFFWPRTKYGSEDQMREVAERVRGPPGGASVSLPAVAGGPKGMAAGTVTVAFFLPELALAFLLSFRIANVAGGQGQAGRPVPIVALPSFAVSEALSARRSALTGT